MEKKSFRNSTINGFYISQARAVGRRYFGQHFDKVIQTETAFDIYIYDSVDKGELDKFRANWPEFNIKLVNVTDYKDQSNNKSKK